MDKSAIENEVRRLQYEIWTRRHVRYPLGVPDLPTLFDPRNVAEHCDLYYDTRSRLETDYRGGGEAAGLWQRDRSTILVSSRFPYEVQRFTAAHEIGHFILHPHVGDRTLHRELPVGSGGWQRSPLEKEADYFAACLLMPRRAVVDEFTARFGKHPLALTETVAYHLKADAGGLFAAPRGSILFAKAVARAEQFDRVRFSSLAQYFGVSAHAMALRLDELNLVAPYL
ncbi:ImmA/IrrE family metallo-endopeptidase [Variovorax sp. CCNWLW235]|uniref:ImmA/IrrE family metallo-endopeptidase n=1 Tax=Variovorax sp. CCNWLW235 TaxID=3127463 RepID=UPI0030772D6A